LSALAASVAENGGVALIAGVGDTVRVVLTSGETRVNAGEIISQVCSLLGGKGGGKPTLAQGGGPNADQLDLALKVGRERIIAALYGR
jgi:alanyl-tRNA synthetase